MVHYSRIVEIDSILEAVIQQVRPEFFYFLFYRFFQPDVRVGGRKKKIIQGRLFFSGHIRCKGRRKKKKRSTSFS